MKKIFFALLCVTALLFGVAQAHDDHGGPPNGVLYGLTFFGRELIRIDPGTGDAFPVATLSAPVNGTGLASRYGKLYSYDAVAGGIVEIDPVTGTVTRVIAVGFTNAPGGEGDIAFRSDGIAFVSLAFQDGTNAVNELYAVDVLGGASQQIGASTFAYDALAFDRNDELYALGQGQGNLYVVNQTNASSTAVGDLGLALESPFAGMTFAANGDLYAAINDRLYTINPQTGAATAVDNEIVSLGFSSVSGLTFESDPPAQELLAISFFTGQIVRVDPFTGDGIVLGTDRTSGTNPAPYFPFGLATFSNRLYTFDGKSSRVLELDPASGAPIGTNDVRIDGVQGEGDITFSTNGVGYISAALDSAGNKTNALFRFNLGTGSSELVGTTPFPLDGLAINTAGDLYALGQGQGTLYRVNQTNASLATVGTNLTVPMNSPFAALTFTPDQRLLAAIDDHIYRVDLGTGNATLLNTNSVGTGFSSISGLITASIPRVGISHENGRIIVFATGGQSLETASVVTGPYAPVPGQSNPLVITNPGTNAFFRARRP